MANGGGLPTSGGGLLTTGGGVGSPGITAQEIEFWETGDLSRWSGDTAAYSASTTNAFQGTYHCRSTGGDLIKAEGTLPNYPERGDYFKFNTAVSDTGADRIRVFWGADLPDDNSGNQYYLYYNLAGPFLRFYVVDNGSRTELADVTFDASPLAVDEYWETHVDFGYSTTDDIEIHVYDGSGNSMFSIGPITDTTSIDNSWTIDTVGWRAFNLSSYADLDWWRINNADQSVGTS